MDKPEKIIAAGAGVLVLATGGFLLCIFFQKEFMARGSLAYAFLSLADFLVCYALLHREVRRTLRKVNDTVQSLVDGKPEPCFDAREESLPGKFQAQIVRLYRIILSHKEEEKKMREELSGLVADLVHQINTPLANIEMYVDFLSREDLDEETRKKFLNNVKSQAEKLGWFGEGFDKAARLETDIISLRPEQAEVLPALLYAIDQVSLKAGRKKMEVCLEGDTSVRALHDSKWTTEAFFNLLDNAVKYGKEGTSIHVRLSAYQLYIRVDVENEGPRIPAKEQAQVFHRFYRGASAALVQEGVGLGLYLVREIISGQGGYVLLENWEDKGSRFSVFLRKS